MCVDTVLEKVKELMHDSSQKGNRKQGVMQNNCSSTRTGRYEAFREKCRRPSHHVNVTILSGVRASEIRITAGEAPATLTWGRSLTKTVAKLMVEAGVGIKGGNFVVVIDKPKLAVGVKV